MSDIPSPSLPPRRTTPSPYDEMRRRADRLLSRAENSLERRKILSAVWAWREAHENRNNKPLEHLDRLTTNLPVTIEEFVDSREFLADYVEVWPGLRRDLLIMNPDVFVGQEPVHEALLGGATGTGKSHLSKITQAYQLYLFCCFKEPQRMFSVGITDAIVFLLQSVSKTITKRVLYEPLRAMFTAMPYTRRWLEWDRYVESELHLSNGIKVVPALANVQAMVGQAVPSGILDEVNFMDIVERSLRAPGPTGEGGRYDQAEETYLNVSRRRKRSFLTRGISLGTLCVVSSTRYKNDFLDRRIDEVRKDGTKNVVWLRRKQYEVVPQDRFSGEKFRVLIGTDDYATRVLNPDDEEGIHYPMGAQIEEVPAEYRSDFMRDPEGAQRDIIGIASNAITPFIAQRDKIVDAILAGETFGLKPWTTKQDVNLQFEGMPQIEEANLPQAPAARQGNRFVHVDLSSSTDRCGIGVVRVLGKQAVQREDGLVEMLPVYAVEEAISIQPTSTHHIDPAEVRGWVSRLVAFYGLSITSVSYDGFQSLESLSLYRRAGIRSQRISLDTSSEPYNVFRRALYDGRIKMVRSEMLRSELSTLEYHAEKDKIDHPPRGSKDVADAVAGAIYAASIYRGVSMSDDMVRPDGQSVRSQRTMQRPQGNIRPR